MLVMKKPPFAMTCDGRKKVREIRKKEMRIRGGDARERRAGESMGRMR
jgi:hypothetical protein